MLLPLKYIRILLKRLFFGEYVSIKLLVSLLFTSFLFTDQRIGNQMLSYTILQSVGPYNEARTSADSLTEPLLMTYAFYYTDERRSLR